MAIENEEVTVILKALDGQGETVDIVETFGSYAPELQLLEFMYDIRKRYPNVTRITMDIAF